MRIQASSLAMVFTFALLGGCLARSRDPYESCIVNSDCRTTSDRCLDVVNGTARDSICSSPCSGGGACPVDRRGALGDCRVLGTGGANCFQACGRDSDCNIGFSCVDPDGGTRRICLPRTSSGTVTVGAYEACSPSRVCTSGTGCFGVTNGAVRADLCTANCRTDAECPSDIRGGLGACLDITGGSMGVCFERCRGGADCRTGFSCDSRTAGGLTLPVSICLP